MILTKKEINRIRAAWKQSEMAEQRSQAAQSRLAAIITETTGVEGNVDHLMGDGMGFTPLSNNDTHIPISDLIGLAESGVDINEEIILLHLVI